MPEQEQDVHERTRSLWIITKNKVSPALQTFSSLSSASFLSSSPAAPARKKLLQGPQQWLTEGF